MTNFQNKIPDFVWRVMRALSAAGYHAFVVGGCVRDLLRGTPPHDFDLTTDATPDEMRASLGDFRLIPTGAAHGTLTVISDSKPVEVTTHRADGDYADARHPDRVFFSRNIEDDLSRRDFTVNAMAWNKERGLVDLFGGREDLENKILRAVGDPEKRFSEDALRILRAFRFSAQLDFAIEEKTALAARHRCAGLSKISVERIFSELQKLLVAPAAERGFAALVDAECLSLAFPGAPLRAEFAARWKSLAPDAPLRLAAIFAGDAADADAFCRKMHTSRAFAERTAALVKGKSAPLPTDLYEARHFVFRFFPVWRDLLSLKEIAGEETGEARRLCEQVVREGSAVDLHRLAVNGKELQDALRIAPADTAPMLSRLQDAVFRDPALNKKRLLLSLAAKEIGREDLAAQFILKGTRKK